jgi:sterol desaturase/sphingolipid hydroxylase (fatty acid hydroxylase superfamily)
MSSLIIGISLIFVRRRNAVKKPNNKKMNTIEYIAVATEILTSISLVLLVAIYSSMQSLSGFWQDVIIISVNLLLVLVPCLVITGIAIMYKKRLSQRKSLWLLIHIFCIILFIYSCTGI